MPINHKLFSKKIPFAPSNLETIDGSMLDYIKDLNLHTMTNTGFKKVPIIWGSAERAFQSKRGKEIRDKRGALILPLISIERTTIEKSLTKKGSVYGNPLPVNDEKGGVLPIARTINQKKTAEFAAADANRFLGAINFPRPNPKVVYQTISIPLPTYVVVNYEITLRTEYQQQMNDLIAPFVSIPGAINYILLKRDGHRFEGFIQEAFNQNNNIADSTNEERKFETKINIQVIGYIIGADKNQSKPNFVYRESIVEVKIPRERLMLNEVPEHEYGAYYGLSGIDFKKLSEIHPNVPFFSNIPAAGSGEGGVINNTVFKNQLNQFYIQREDMSEAVGNGNRIFVAGAAFKVNSEQVFFNGMLLFPGEADDYVVSADQRTITLSAEAIPQTAAEKGGGEAVDDTILISYIVE
tara:strand:+ start:5028 stop:6257 length:1230 start_codon:yes stop_codon:yes gene_type:complete